MTELSANGPHQSSNSQEIDSFTGHSNSALTRNNRYDYKSESVISSVETSKSPDLQSVLQNYGIDVGDDLFERKSETSRLLVNTINLMND